MKDAVLVVEFRAIHQGIGALDHMLKRAAITVLHAGPICIGKYLICVGGDVADVEEAEKASAEGFAPFSSYLLTGAHASILGYFQDGPPRVRQVPPAIGVVETRSAASGFQSLDHAQKGACTQLLRLWLGQQLGGKFCYILGGVTGDVQSALRAAETAIRERELVGTQLVLSPEPGTLGLFEKGGGPHGSAESSL